MTNTEKAQTELSTTSAPAKIPGHAYRPTKHPLGGRNKIPGCECGAYLAGWTLPDKDARSVHREHKKQVLKDLAKAGRTDAIEQAESATETATEATQTAPEASELQRFASRLRSEYALDHSSTTALLEQIIWLAERDAKLGV